MDVAYREVRDRIERARSPVPRRHRPGLHAARTTPPASRSTCSAWRSTRVGIRQLRPDPERDHAAARAHRRRGLGRGRRPGREGDPDRARPREDRGRRAEHLSSWPRSSATTTSPWPAAPCATARASCCCARWPATTRSRSSQNRLVDRSVRLGDIATISYDAARAGLPRAGDEQAGRGRGRAARKARPTSARSRRPWSPRSRKRCETNPRLRRCEMHHAVQPGRGDRRVADDAAQLGHDRRLDRRHACCSCSCAASG